MAGPHTIMVIRGQPYGIDENGARNAGSLTPRGTRRRAGCISCVENRRRQRAPVRDGHSDRRALYARAHGTTFRRPDADEMVIACATLKEKKVPRWPSSGLDLVWLFLQTDGGYRLKIVPQNLLSRDSDVA